jgi:hypothetical protein
MPSVAVDPFLIISVKNIGFVGIEIEIAVAVWIELGAFPAIFLYLGRYLIYLLFNGLEFLLYVIEFPLYF